MKTKQPRKQRARTMYTTDLHILKRNVHAHLSKSLIEKYKIRTFGVKVGDSIKIVRGTYFGKTGKVERINTRIPALFIEGIDTKKADGTKTKVSIHPSNVILTDIDVSDKMRKMILERKQNKGVVKAKEAAKR